MVFAEIRKDHSRRHVAVENGFATMKRHIKCLAFRACIVREITSAIASVHFIITKATPEMTGKLAMSVGMHLGTVIMVYIMLLVC